MYERAVITLMRTPMLITCPGDILGFIYQVLLKDQLIFTPL